MKRPQLTAKALNDDGEVVEMTITKWSEMTGKNRDSIRHHIYQQKERGLTDREVVGLDTPPKWCSQRVKIMKKMKRQAKAREEVCSYLLKRFLSTRLVNHGGVK